MCSISFECLPEVSGQGREIHWLYIALVTAPAHKNDLDLLCMPVAVDGCAHGACVWVVLGYSSFGPVLQEFWQNHCFSGDRELVKSGKHIWENLGSLMQNHLRLSTAAGNKKPKWTLSGYVTVPGPVFSWCSVYGPVKRKGCWCKTKQGHWRTSPKISWESRERTTISNYHSWCTSSFPK